MPEIKKCNFRIRYSSIEHKIYCGLCLFDTEIQGKNHSTTYTKINPLCPGEENCVLFQIYENMLNEHKTISKSFNEERKQRFKDAWVSSNKKMSETNTKDTKLADEHWDYVSSICEKMYKDAFIHGYKHGLEDGVK